MSCFTVHSSGFSRGKIAPGTSPSFSFTFLCFFLSSPPSLWLFWAVLTPLHFTLLFAMFVSRPPPDHPINARALSLVPGYHSFPKWAMEKGKKWDQMRTHRIVLKPHASHNLHDVHNNVWDFYWDWYTATPWNVKTKLAYEPTKNRVKQLLFWRYPNFSKLMRTIHTSVNSTKFLQRVANKRKILPLFLHRQEKIIARPEKIIASQKPPTPAYQPLTFLIVRA